MPTKIRSSLTTLLFVILGIFLTASLIITVTGFLKVKQNADFVSLGYFNLGELILGISIGIVLLIVCYLLAVWLSHRFAGWYLFALGLITLPKFGLVFFWHLKPATDMATYNAVAGLHSAGLTWPQLFLKGYLENDAIWPHMMNISETYSVVYWLFGNQVWILQLFQIALTFSSAILIYATVKHFASRKIALFSGLLFYLLPTDYWYSSLLGSENLELFSMLLAIYGLFRLLDTNIDLKSQNWWTTFIFTIFALILAQMIRPDLPIVLIAIIIFGLLAAKRSQWSTFLAILLVAVAFVLFSPAIERTVYQVPIAPSFLQAKYTITTGIDLTTGGRFNPEVANTMLTMNGINPKTGSLIHPAKSYAAQRNQTNRNIQQINQYLTSKFNSHNNYWRDNQNQLPGFVRAKAETLASPIYGDDYLLISYPRQLDNNYGTVYSQPKPVNRLWVYISYGFEILLMILGCGSLFPDKNTRSLRIFMALMFIGLSLFSLIVEVQSRYQAQLDLPLIILAGLGFERLRFLATSLSAKLKVVL